MRPITQIDNDIIDNGSNAPLFEIGSIFTRNGTKLIVLTLNPGAAQYGIVTCYDIINRMIRNLPMNEMEVFNGTIILTQ